MSAAHASAAGGGGTAALRPAAAEEWPVELVPYELRMRLLRFRDAHPGVRIRPGPGYWQAITPEPSGETVVTRHTLRKLLDRLDGTARPAAGQPPG